MALLRPETRAARLGRAIGAPGGDERTEPIDFAEFVTLAVAGAAANIGGIDAVLAGRPGSWEADYVRNMLVSTVGEDAANLLEHRTEPLRVQVNIDEVLNDLDYWKLHDEATEEVTRRDEAVIEPSVPVDDDPEHRAVWDAYEATCDANTALVRTPRCPRRGGQGRLRRSVPSHRRGRDRRAVSHPAGTGRGRRAAGLAGRQPRRR